MEKNYWKKIILLLVIAGLAGAFFIFDLNTYFSLAGLKGQLDTLKAFYAHNKALTIMLYMIIYIVMAGLSLPGATIMTLAGGAVFDTLTGTILVSFAGTSGATLAFLLTKYIFRDFAKKKFSEKLTVINRGIKKDGVKAKIISPFKIDVNGKILSTKNIIIATGARPMIPALKGIEKIKYLTSDNIWDLRDLPENLMDTMDMLLALQPIMVR